MTLRQRAKKPFYKKILFARYNHLNNRKIFNFRKKKWGRFKFYCKLKLKYFKRFRFFDQSRVYVNKFSSTGNKFKKNFKNYLMRSEGIKLIYGGFKRRPFKRLVGKLEGINKGRINKSFQNNNIKTLLGFEERLDSVLYRSHFCQTIKQAKQIIKHGHVRVNKKRIRVPGLKLRYGDQVNIVSDSKIKDLVRENIVKSSLWPVPPKFLKINYKTATIINLSKNLGIENLFFRYNLKIDLIRNNARFK